MARVDYYFILFAVITLTAFIRIIIDWAKRPNANEQKENALTAIKEILYQFIIDAEKFWGGGTGIVKRSFVINSVLNSQFYITLPDFIKMFINATMIGKLIDNMVDNVLKPALKNNINLQKKIQE